MDIGKIVFWMQFGIYIVAFVIYIAYKKINKHNLYAEYAPEDILPEFFSMNKRQLKSFNKRILETDFNWDDWINSPIEEYISYNKNGIMIIDVRTMHLYEVED